MSYNPETSRLLAGSSATNETPDNKVKYTSTWKLIGAIGAVSIVGCVAFSASYFPTQSASQGAARLNAMHGQLQQQLNPYTYATKSEQEQYELFKGFALKFNKKYSSSAEERIRFEKFKKFLAIVDLRNAAEAQNGGSAVHGITRFADFDDEEIKERMMGYKRKENNEVANDSTPYRKIYKLEQLHLGEQKKAEDADHRPEKPSLSVDWSSTYATMVKDQGYCGSCWAFSATEQLESDAIRLGLLTREVALSPQQVVSCDQADWGCNGGNTETAYVYMMKNNGLTTDEKYPYSSYYGATGSCTVDSISSEDQQIITLDSFTTIEGGEPEMSHYVLNNGPISVCLDASTWSSYESGVVSVCGRNIDHCVQVTGVNMDDGENSYWLVRNSWGTTWGLDGYIKLRYGQDTCGITYDPTFTSPVRSVAAATKHSHQLLSLSSSSASQSQ